MLLGRLRMWLEQAGRVVAPTFEAFWKTVHDAPEERFVSYLEALESADATRASKSEARKRWMAAEDKRTATFKAFVDRQKRVIRKPKGDSSWLYLDSFWGGDRARMDYLLEIEESIKAQVDAKGAREKLRLQAHR